MPGSWHCFSLQCLYRATVLVNIHIAIVKETEIQPGDNSQSISAISLGLHLKALSQIAEMIHCTWLCIIIAVVILYYPFLIFFLSSAGMPMEVMQIFTLCFPYICQASVQQNHCSSAAFWVCICPHPGFHSTFPTHRHKAEQSCASEALVLLYGNSWVFSFRTVQKYLNNHEKEKKFCEGNWQQWN